MKYGESLFGILYLANAPSRARLRREREKASRKLKEGK